MKISSRFLLGVVFIIPLTRVTTLILQYASAPIEQIRSTRMWKINVPSFDGSGPETARTQVSRVSIESFFKTFPQARHLHFERAWARSSIDIEKPRIP